MILGQETWRPRDARNLRGSLKSPGHAGVDAGSWNLSRSLGREFHPFHILACFLFSESGAATETASEDPEWVALVPCTWSTNSAKKKSMRSKQKLMTGPLR